MGIEFVTVVPDKSTFDTDLHRGTVVLESADRDFARAIETLRSAEVRNLAIAHAAKQGMSGPRINGNVTVYPVNLDGLPLDQVVDASGQTPAQTHPRMQPRRYRVDVPVARPF